jgi:hypothetical protein
MTTHTFQKQIGRENNSSEQEHIKVENKVTPTGRVLESVVLTSHEANPI